MSKKDTTFIYALIDPETQLVRYVGKANNPACRFSGHLNPRCLRANTYKNKWINKLISKGLKPELRILEEVSVTEWQEKEIYWIAHYREVSGTKLTNLTNGGDGLGHGFKFSKETRARMSKAGKIRWAGLAPEERKRLTRNWTPTKEQLSNWSKMQRGRKVEGSVSKFIGVSRNPSGSWKAYISIDGKAKSCGHYESEIQAALAVDKAIRFYFGESSKTNFEGGEASSCEDLRTLAKRLGKKTSQYNGVCFKKGQYIANITVEKKVIEIGCFYLERNAALAFDLYVKENNLKNRKINFEKHPEITLAELKIQDKNSNPKNREGVSQYRGVSPHKDFWSAMITLEGKGRFLGLYKTEELAAKAYDAAARFYLKDKAITNFKDSEVALSIVELKQKARAENKPNKVSKYYCVSLEKRTGKWYSSIYANGKANRLGTFSSEEEAARAVDKFILENKLNRPLNFPDNQSL